MRASDRRNPDANDDRLQETVNLLLHEARDGFDERRAEKRQPFFTPIQIAFANDERRQFSCFSRDISATSIGLLHYMAVQPGEVVLTIPSKLCGKVRVRSEIVWCQPCGEGWYMSGARFVELLSSL